MATDGKGRWRWLKTPGAIKVHFIFLLAIAALSSELLSGNNGPHGDYAIGLVFFCIGYPLMLFLFWLTWRATGDSDI
jgi:hypothetical protein